MEEPTPPAAATQPPAPEVPRPTENWAAFGNDIPSNPPPANPPPQAAPPQSTGSIFTDLSFPSATPAPVSNPQPTASTDLFGFGNDTPLAPTEPAKLPENASMVIMKENTSPAAPAQPLMAPA